MLKRCLAIGLAMIMVFAMAACGNGGDSSRAEPSSDNASSADASGDGDSQDGAAQPAAGGGDGEVLKIGAITSLSGALQDYGECYQRGFLLGLEYMTQGTNVVAGRPIEVIWEDTTNTPDVAKERTLKLLEQDKVEMATGYDSSGDAVGGLPVFEE